MTQEKKAIDAIRENSQPQKVIKDESSIRDRLIAMGYDILPDIYSKYLKLYSECSAKARDADM